MNIEREIQKLDTQIQREENSARAMMMRENQARLKNIQVKQQTKNKN